MIVYSLYKSHLTASSGSYYPRIVGGQTYGPEEIISKMISRGSTVTKAEAFGVMEEYALAIVDILSNGGNISTPLFSIRPTASGKFSDPLESWDSTKHSLRFKLKPGVRIMDVLSQVQMKRQKANLPKPELIELLDATTGQQSLNIVPSKVNILRGSGLNVDMVDQEQGVFLTPTGGDPVRVEDFGRVKPSEILFTVPGSLDSGEYSLEVRTRRTANSEMRIGLLPYLLMVS